MEDKYDNKDSMTSSDSEKDILNDLKSKDEINQVKIFLFRKLLKIVLRE